jgi:Growth factor receptor domain IV
LVTNIKTYSLLNLCYYWQGPDKCSQCRHFSYNNTCVQRCKSSHYVEGKFCYDCHPYCVQFGCSGPGNGIGPGKCNKCPRVRLTDEDRPTVTECLDPKSTECGIGYQKLEVCSFCWCSCKACMERNIYYKSVGFFEIHFLKFWTPSVRCEFNIIKI